MFVYLFEGTKRAAAPDETLTYRSLGITVVLRHRRIGPEPRSGIEGEPTVQRSGYSSPGFPKHKKQLQRDLVGSRTRRCDLSRMPSPPQR